MRTAIALLFCSAVAYCQTPSVSNARMETRAASGDNVAYLHSLIRGETGPAWFGYAVESNQPNEESCCWENNDRGCRLEGGEGGHGIRVSGNGPVKLEGSREVFVLYRVQGGSVGKIQPVSGSCPLDAGGLKFIWVTGIDAKASLALLSEQVESASGKHAQEGALVTIALHAGAAADETLEKFAAQSQPEELREKALFWLANSRGDRGFTAVKNAAERDPSEHLREKTMFYFTLCKPPAAIDELIHFAKQDPAARVRSQALFWLAQKAGNRAAGAITDAINNDPDTEVKKKAVFALQNLPKAEGVPLLIDVAKTNRNAEVRKQAMFWLGQSGDPRALAFFQEVLAR